MKSKIKYVSLLFVIVFIVALFLLIIFQTTSNRYSYDDIPRKYIIGEITSISEQDEAIELLLDNGEASFGSHDGQWKSKNL